MGVIHIGLHHKCNARFMSAGLVESELTPAELDDLQLRLGAERSCISSAHPLSQPWAGLSERAARVWCREWGLCQVSMRQVAEMVALIQAVVRK